MTINEQDIELTNREKFNDFFNFSLLSIIVMIPVVIIILVLLPVLIVLGLFYENVIENCYYKLTGKKRKHLSPKLERPYEGLPISIDFKYVWLIDNCADDLIEKYNLTEEDIFDLEIGKIETNPKIADLEDKYFDHQTIVFQDKLFVREIKLQDLTSSIGYIDFSSLEYQTIKDLNSYPKITFNKTADELQITLRQRGMKKLIIVK